ncbi:hypothetical protein PTTG_08528 [Puccinia triticina 1-1 BBBD Race 1]|uniref:Uncharacterized protein n=1 Tax=Puccinia triticina (isolate 1-1 / race 1 (BBBD)) TaxID=630390 RepID=A0A180H1K6_PUCT1|nr:hypothetical protein PTTG_08528 [Puccinia triticina 1-1 BBBD Race 1]WAR60553.1 hypothetical protein PtB15_9B492 [Puccinia triticina]
MFTNTGNSLSRSNVPFPTASTSQNSMAGSGRPTASPRQRRAARCSSSARIPSRLSQSIVFDRDGNAQDGPMSDAHRAPALPTVTHYGNPMLGAHGRNADSSDRGIQVYSETASPLAQPPSPPHSPELPSQPPSTPTSPSFYLYSRPFHPNPPGPHMRSPPELYLSPPSTPPSSSASSDSDSEESPEETPSPPSDIPPSLLPAPRSAAAPVAGPSRLSAAAPLASSGQRSYPRLEALFRVRDAPDEADVPAIRDTNVRSREGSVDSTSAPSTVFLSPASSPGTSRFDPRSIFRPAQPAAKPRVAPRGLPSVRAFVPASQTRSAPAVSSAGPFSARIAAAAERRVTSRGLPSVRDFVPANPPAPSASSRPSQPANTSAGPGTFQVELPESRQPVETSVLSSGAQPGSAGASSLYDFLLQPLANRPAATFTTSVRAPSALPGRRSRPARLSVRFDLPPGSGRSPAGTSRLQATLNRIEASYRRIQANSRVLQANSRRSFPPSLALSAVSTTSTAGSPPRRHISFPESASTYLPEVPQRAPDFPPPTSPMVSPNAPPRYSLVSRQGRTSPRVSLTLSQSAARSLPLVRAASPSPSPLPSSQSASLSLPPARAPSPSPPPSPLAHRSPSISPARTLVHSLSLSPISLAPSPPPSPARTAVPSPPVSPARPLVRSPTASPVRAIVASPRFSPARTVVPSPRLSPARTAVPSPRVSPARTAVPSLRVSSARTAVPSPRVSPVRTVVPAQSPAANVEETASREIAVAPSTNPSHSGYQTRSKRRREAEAAPGPAAKRLEADRPAPKGKGKAPVKRQPKKRAAVDEAPEASTSRPRKTAKASPKAKQEEKADRPQSKVKGKAPAKQQTKKSAAVDTASPQASTSRSGKATEASTKVKRGEDPAQPRLVRRKVGRPAGKGKGATTKKTVAEPSRPSTSRSAESAGNGEGTSTTLRYSTRSKRKRGP